MSTQVTPGASTELEVVAPQPVKPPNVPVGPTSLVGWAATAAGVVGMVLVLVLKVPEQEATLIATSAMTVIAFVVTQVGRYAQSRELAKGAADVSHTVAQRAAFPPRILDTKTGVISSVEDEAPAGDPDHPLREMPLSDEELEALAASGDIDDPATDPPQGRVVPDR